MIKITWLLCIVVVLLSSCAPSENAIQTAIAQTQAVLPTSTLKPTATPQPTDTPIPAATLTPLPSPTADIRLIDIDPRKLLLQKSNLPSEGRYFLPGQGWISPVRNSEIVSSWTVEEGQTYLAETGRIDGWLVTYKRGVSGVLIPEEVYDNVVIYSSTEGARLLITKYSDSRVTDEHYAEIDVPQAGDAARAFEKRETNSGGGTRVWILVSFSYRNVVHSINIFGWEKEISLDFAVSIANELLEGLKQLPLSDTVTFKP